MGTDKEELLGAQSVSWQGIRHQAGDLIKALRELPKRKSEYDYTDMKDCLHQAFKFAIFQDPVIHAVFREHVFDPPYQNSKKPEKVTDVPEARICRLAELINDVCGKRGLDINLFRVSAISYNAGDTLQFYGSHVPAVCFALYGKQITPPIVRYSLTHDAWDYILDDTEKGYVAQQKFEKGMIKERGVYKIPVHILLKENIPKLARSRIEDGTLISPIEFPKFREDVPYNGCYMETTYEGVKVEESYFYDVCAYSYNKRGYLPKALPPAFKNYPESFFYTKTINKILSRVTRSLPYQVAIDNVDMVTKQEVSDVDYSKPPEGYAEFEKKKNEEIEAL